jgi:hypothetical protein
MRSNVANDCFLFARFAYKSNTTLSQIADATVQQTAGAAARSRGEVGLFHEPDPQAPQRRVARDSRPHDATPDYENIQGALLELGNRIRAVHAKSSFAIRCTPFAISIQR